MRIRILLFPILTLFCLTSNAQDSKVFWAQQLQLDWTNYLCAPDANVKYHAKTEWGIDCTVTVDRGVSLILVRPYIDQNTSWVRLEEKTPQLLTHQQLHFDIAELYARRMREAFSKMSFDHANLADQINEKYTEIFMACMEYQALYDFETNHSSKPLQQIEWISKIEKAMRESIEFESKGIPIVYN